MANAVLISITCINYIKSTAISCFTWFAKNKNQKQLQSLLNTSFCVVPKILGRGQGLINFRKWMFPGLWFSLQAKNFQVFQLDIFPGGKKNRYEELQKLRPACLILHFQLYYTFVFFQPKRLWTLGLNVPASMGAWICSIWVMSYRALIFIMAAYPFWSIDQW